MPFWFPHSPHSPKDAESNPYIRSIARYKKEEHTGALLPPEEESLLRLANSLRALIVAPVIAGAAALPSSAHAGVSLSISVNLAPPALPVYAQPVCPGPGFLWTPGYWAYGPRGYYWVSGAWVRPPAPGLLWTPAYWRWEGGRYRFHAGYWGPQVGFYGGINYGFGYPGTGFEGGQWRGRDFFYNTAVSHVDAVHMRNVYRQERHFDEHDRDHRAFFDTDHRERPAAEHGWAHEERDHHDNGIHNGWNHDERDHHDNGNHDGWDHHDHGHRDH